MHAEARLAQGAGRSSRSKSTGHTQEQRQGGQWMVAGLVKDDMERRNNRRSEGGASRDRGRRAWRDELDPVAAVLVAVCQHASSSVDAPYACNMCFCSPRKRPLSPPTTGLEASLHRTAQHNTFATTSHDPASRCLVVEERETAFASFRGIWHGMACGRAAVQKGYEALYCSHGHLRSSAQSPVPHPFSVQLYTAQYWPGEPYLQLPSKARPTLAEAQTPAQISLWPWDLLAAKKVTAKASRRQ